MGITRQLYIFALFALWNVNLCAQADSTRFHEVKAGETKYGIAKQYNLSIEQLESYNPEIKEGLKAGSELLIPTLKAASEPKDTLPREDDEYIYHEVKAQQTLYSLAKDYGLGIGEIKEHNPKLESDGLKIGQILKIPRTRLSEKALQQRSDEFYIHTVRPEETAYSLGKQYGLSLDSLYLLNPKAEEGLLIGQEIRIPLRLAPEPKEVKKLDSVQTQRPQAQLSSDEKPAKDTAKPQTSQDDYFLHKVKTGDSFYAFRKNFGVEREELLKLNPELEEGLIVGRYIIIPRKKKAEKTTWLDRLFNKVEEPQREPLEEKTESLKDSLNETPIKPLEGPVVEIADTVEIDIEKNYRIALMLPFQANQLYDTVSVRNWEVTPTSEMSLQFYQGFLMAADSLSQAGMNITLNTFDTRQSLSRVKELMPRIEDAQYDLVVGPAFKQNVEFVADALQDESVPVLSPLSMAVEVKNRPNLIQVVPDNESRLERIAEILNRKFGDANIVFAHSGGLPDLKKVQQVKARLNPRNDSNFIENAVITKENFSKGNILRDLINGKGKTAVVLVSSEKVFISDVVGKLSALNDTSIYLVGSSRLLNMETVENEYLNKLNFTMTDVRFTDYSDSTTQSFIAAFREKYKVEPSPFAMQGYDIGLFFLEKLWKSGVYFQESLAGQSGVKLSTGFDMAKTPEGGYINRFLFVTGIRQFELVRIPLPDPTQLKPLPVLKELQKNPQGKDVQVQKDK